MMPFPPPSWSFRSSLWTAARLMPAVIGRRRLDDILRRATPPAGARAYGGLAPEAIIAAVKRAARRPWRMRDRRCLREGLLAFHYLALAGHRPVLHFGLVPKSVKAGRPRAHCWVSIDGAVVLNPPAEPMIDLLSYDGADTIAASARLLDGADHD